MALGHSGTHYWIGCTDRQIEGIWRWSDGSSLSYTNWAPTQPDNADGIQDCGILYSIYGYAQWDDTECSTPYFFICQTDINECSNDNGGCSHNCENTDGSYRCICQDGYQLSGLTDCRDEDDKTPGTLENILSSVVPPITTIVVVILIVIAIIFAISKYKNKTTPDNSNSPPPPYSQRMAWK
ncbi:E-selectin-like isoform X2 [Branchiostoma floridae]|uniref:E-selectin-like isoform X2 n=1 Tax=Branchiostoma floridae TaxID=7739 RepID=A0A9J7LRM5_BRAFL|nr:E-selectin-like isoform X2 [Branchiostoma floridae]